MPRQDPTDQAGFATLARQRDREIRPTLLRLQAQAFAEAPVRDRRACETFEALACGLLPLVPDAVVAEIATILARVPETPAPLRRLLAERLSAPAPVRAARDPALDRAALPPLLATDRRDVDLALAANRAVALDARAIAVLVERGRRDGDLARLLLDRPEPGALDRAALYLHADRPRREAIRLALARAAAVSSPSLPRPTSAGRARLLACAAAGDWAGLLAAIGTALAIAPAPDWPRDREAARELAVLCLGLLGLDAADRLASIAAVAPALGPDEPARLAQLGGVPVGIAALLVGAGTAPPVSRPRPAPAGTARDDGEDRRPRRGATARPARAEGTSDRPGRRSRSTTGPDRT